MKRNILLMFVWAFCSLVCSCEEDSEKSMVQSVGFSERHAGLYMKITNKVDVPESEYSNIKSMGVCYVANEKRKPTVDDYVALADEIDSKGLFSVYITDFPKSCFILYRPFIETGKNIYYGEPETLFVETPEAFEDPEIALEVGEMKPHSFELYSNIDLGPINPKDFDYYIWCGNSTSSDIDEKSLLKTSIEGNNVVRATITGYSYMDVVYSRLVMIRKSDNTIVCSPVKEIEVPQLRIKITTMMPSEASMEGMVLTGKADLIFAEAQDVDYKISYSSLNGRNVLDATFNEQDSTFSIKTPRLQYNYEYEYKAYAEYNWDYVFFANDDNGETLTFITPMPNLPSGPVDLGLSVKWNSVNIGAETPYDLGYTFQWADVQPKTNKDIEGLGNIWLSYKYGTSSDSITKYCVVAANEYQLGVPDGKSVLEPDDDAATAILGSQWHTPSIADWEELRDKCIWSYTVINDVKGFVVEADNGNMIFLSFRDYYNCYWTNSLMPNMATSSAAAIDLYHINPANNDFDIFGVTESRCSLLPIRAVCTK